MKICTCGVPDEYKLIHATLQKMEEKRSNGSLELHKECGGMRLTNSALIGLVERFKSKTAKYWALRDTSLKICTCGFEKDLYAKLHDVFARVAINDYGSLAAAITRAVLRVCSNNSDEYRVDPVFFDELAYAFNEPVSLARAAA